MAKFSNTRVWSAKRHSGRVQAFYVDLETSRAFPRARRLTDSNSTVQILFAYEIKLTEQIKNQTITKILLKKRIFQVKYLAKKQFF